MRKTTTIICSIAFMISGIMLALWDSQPQCGAVSRASPNYGYKSITAATLPTFPVFSNDTNVIDLPQDLLLDLAKKKGLSVTETTTVDTDSALVDSLKQRISDLEQTRQVTKVKWRKAPAPKPVVVRDTIREAHYYLATQVGTKEGPTGECISVYEVHKVDEICTETNNSSIELSNESDNIVWE